MAAIRYKELLGSYVITLKLRETVESRLPEKSTNVSKIVPDHEPRPPKSEWVISIEEKLMQGCQENMLGSWAKLSIYRIPRHLKHGEDKAWVPQIVSLGPYHHGDEHLRHMERHKWRSLHRILERSGQGIALYLESVKKCERRARACYEESISMTCDKFVEMMVLDGYFVIEMFQGFAEGFEELGYPPNDPVFSMRGSILQIQRDMIMLEMIMLENHIPLFILGPLLGLQLSGPNQKERVAKLALQFFIPLTGDPRIALHRYPIHWQSVHLRRMGDSKRLNFDPLHDHGKVHCLEVVWRRFLHLDLKRHKAKKRSQRREQLTLCLSKLREAGIQIKWISGDSWSDIHFENGNLGIPPIEIHKGTRLLFLNLIAFEQSHFNCSHYVTSYVIFMPNLINSPEDVLYLRNQGIIHHCLGSDAEVADLFHRLCQEVAFGPKDSYLWDKCKELRAYYCGLYHVVVDHDGAPITCYGATRMILALLWDSSIAFLTRDWNRWKSKWNGWKSILTKNYLNSPGQLFP